jgi:hypothetical protein
VTGDGVGDERRALAGFPADAVPPSPGSMRGHGNHADAPLPCFLRTPAGNLRQGAVQVPAAGADISRAAWAGGPAREFGAE